MSGRVAEELPELDVGRPEAVERRGQPLRALRLRHAAPFDAARKAGEQARTGRKRVGVDVGEGAFARQQEAGAGHPEKGGDGSRHQSFQPEWIAAIPPERLR